MLNLAFSKFNLIFGAGVVMGIVFLRNSERIPVLTWSGTALTFIMVLVWIGLAFFGYHHLYPHVLLLAPILCCGLALAATVKNKPCLPARMFKLFGDASYSVYLLHGATISAILSFFYR